MAELIHNFGVDWKLLAAQAVNFFILLFLLAKFAYRPILEMLRRRRADIEKGLAFSKEAEEKLVHVGEEVEAKLGQAHKDALGIVSAAEAKAKEKEAIILKTAELKSDDLVVNAKKAIEEERSKMQEEIFDDAKDLVRNGIAAVLTKLPPRARDEALIQAALEELKVSEQK